MIKSISLDILVIGSDLVAVEDIKISIVSSLAVSGRSLTSKVIFLLILGWLTR
jgi:hypothetical protein